MKSGASFTITPFVAGLLCLTAACSSSDAEQDSVPERPEAALGPPPFLAAGAIGVSDMARSFDFYTRVLGMALRHERSIAGFVNQRVLHFPAGKASDVVLMDYVDGQPHNYTRNPVKLVFYAPSASALIEAIRNEGLQIIAEPAVQPASSAKAWTCSRRRPSSTVAKRKQSSRWRVTQTAIPSSSSRHGRAGW